MSAVRCPRCAAPLNVLVPEIVCTPCSLTFPRVSGIPLILDDPNRYLASCRNQLLQLEQQSALTIQTIDAQLQIPFRTRATTERLAALRAAVVKQMDDIRRVLEPLVGGGAQVTAESSGVECPVAAAAHSLFIPRLGLARRT